MAKLTLIKSITGMFIILQLSGSAVAGPSNGVYCKSGTIRQYSNRILKCYTKQTKTFKLGSMCPPLNHLNNITMKSKGRDTCLPVGSGNSVPSAMTPPLIGYPPTSRFRRVIRRKGVDKFIAKVTKRKYQHPRGKSYFHNPKKGVICPSGSSSIYKYGRLKCIKKTTKKATCDGIFKLKIDRDGKTDQCISETIFGTIMGKYTIPVGYSGLSGNPSRHGWHLDSRRGRDKWVKTKYVYPKGR